MVWGNSCVHCSGVSFVNVTSLVRAVLHFCFPEGMLPCKLGRESYENVRFLKQTLIVLFLLSLLFTKGWLVMLSFYQKQNELWNQIKDKCLFVNTCFTILKGKNGVVLKSTPRSYTKWVTVFKYFAQRTYSSYCRDK